MYQFLVFLHVVSAFAFFMAHGASAVMAFQLRRESQLERIKAILDLSNAALPVAYIALMFLLLAGIGAGIIGNWFSHGWIWAAIVLLLLMWFGMVVYSARFFTPIRKAVGLPYRDREGEHAAETPASQAEIAALIQGSNPFIIGGMYFTFILLMLWLMMYKPF
jgi:hypothetical protein